MAAAASLAGGPAARAYTQALAGSPFVRMLLAGRLPFEWAVTRMVSDDPRRGWAATPMITSFGHACKGILGMPCRESTWFPPISCPGRRVSSSSTALATSGVKTSVLTNSLEATDVPAVYAGYARRRKPLLKAGVRLFEMKLCAFRAEPPVKAHKHPGQLNLKSSRQDLLGRLLAACSSGRLISTPVPHGSTLKWAS